MIQSMAHGRLQRIYGFIVTVFVLIPLINSIAIDNEVIGIPQVQCSEDAVTFAVRTRNAFNGNIYIKGKFNEPNCRQEFFSNTFNGASYTVRIPLCGMRRIRQLQPQGMNYILVFVVNFHPQFNTKVDRAYNVRCFYAQQEKTVTSQLEVSMLSTQNLEAATMLMPNCEYSIRSGSLNGPRVRFVRVGDRLVHRWECDNPNFGMLIKNCFVNDGYGSSVRVLDSRGCPVFTPVIQGPLQYDNSLNLAYVEVWAYKFPDRQDLYFQCQVQVCNKRENECVGITPPNCPLIPRPGFTPSSIVEPYVTGPYGPVTVIRGTFFPGQEIVAGPYVQPVIQPGVQPGLGSQQIIPAPAPYGPPFGQQVLPGYVPGVQAPIGSQIVGVPNAGGYGYGYAAASDEGTNAGHQPSVGGNVPRNPTELDQQSSSQSIPTPTSVSQFTVRSNGGQAHEFNADIRNDDSQATRPTKSSNSTSNTTFATPRVSRGNDDKEGDSTTNAQPRPRNKNQPDRRKSRRDAGNHDSRQNRFYTSPGPIDFSDESSETTSMPTSSRGDVHLMDVTAEMVYVADVGDSENGEDLKHYPFATISAAEAKQVCLNPVAFSLLFSCFAVLVITIALLLVYLLTKHGRWSLFNGRSFCEVGDSRKWASAGTLSTASSTSMPKPKMDKGDEEIVDTNVAAPTTEWTTFPDDKQNDKSALSSIFSRRLSVFGRERLQAS